MPSPQPTSSAPERGSVWRSLLFFLPIVLWTLGTAGAVAIVAVLWPRFRRGGFLPWARLWGRLPLALCGVRLEVHGAERLEAPGGRIVLFNHASLLDIYVLAATLPRNPVVLYKKEFSRVPGLGPALRSLGMIPVDRSDHQAAVRSLAEAGRRIRDEQANCLMAPEGTRSRLGGLQNFKLGAFHLAAEHGIPLVPMIARGVERAMPMGALLVRSGTVRIDFLEPITTTGWTKDDVREHARDVRRQFLEYLDPAPGCEGAA